MKIRYRIEEQIIDIPECDEINKNDLIVELILDDINHNTPFEFMEIPECAD
jgi:hypothetical protein